MIVLYSNNCPNCRRLKAMLDEKNFNYEIVTDLNVFKEKRFSHMPMLEVDGKLMNFKTAFKWMEGNDEQI